MAKTKSSPKKRGGKTNEKEKVDAAPTSSPAKSTKSTKSKKASTSQTTKKTPLQTRTAHGDSNDVDSGISSPEKPTRKAKKRISSSASTISKVTKKSKVKKIKESTKWLQKKSSDIDWLKGLLQKDLIGLHNRIKTPQGIEVRYPRSLSFRVENDIQYVTYPANNGKCSGYVKIDPGCEKIKKKTVTSIKLMIMIGKIHLVLGKESHEHKAGAIMSIPKGTTYGLRNNAKETCYIRFQTVLTDD